MQEDMVCLSCTATGERVCLAAEGFGNRHCFLENIADKVSVHTVFSTSFFLLFSTVMHRWKLLEDMLDVLVSEEGQSSSL